ncbi:MAG TPA: hypothetical protein EYN02_03915 [Candidatus Marinimicrobia bacterium]|nr:hypothetical protein [Candidatus Neomarinimicrobiota bacterium]
MSINAFAAASSSSASTFALFASSATSLAFSASTFALFASSATSSAVAGVVATPILVASALTTFLGTLITLLSVLKNIPGSAAC